jgi:hypothetical protein
LNGLRLADIEEKLFLSNREYLFDKTKTWLQACFTLHIPKNAKVLKILLKEMYNAAFMV